jgi:dolichyl-phosphate beta-glucosyltransferase
MTMEDSPHAVALSIILPAYNEAQRLRESLRQIRAWLATRPDAAEVIVVDDGSTDATAAIVRETMSDWPSLRLHSALHAGKGAAVRAGTFLARGRLIAFADCDLSMPIGELGRLYDMAQDSEGVVIASREAPGARRYGEPWYRHTMGRVFNRLVQLLLLPGIEDTQCGFKCMPREIALALCSRQTISGWGFDAELLVIARRHGFAIHEVPIPWYYMANSRVRLARDTISMAREVLAIRANVRAGKYDPPRDDATARAQHTNEKRNIHAS